MTWRVQSVGRHQNQNNSKNQYMLVKMSKSLWKKEKIWLLEFSACLKMCKKSFSLFYWSSKLSSDGCRCSVFTHMKLFLSIYLNKKIFLLFLIFWPFEILRERKAVFVKESLTHYQTTNFRPFKTERVCRWQFQIWWKWQKVIQMVETLWEKEKLHVTSNFSFSHSVFKRLFPRGLKRCHCVGMD